METSGISIAKLSRPRLHLPIARIPLYTRLDQLRTHPLIWVSGSPGSGKTTLVASYLEAQDVRAIWYQVDAGDADPSTFFYYLGVALKCIAPNESSLPFLTPDYLPDVNGFTRRFFRELFSRVPAGMCIVLDNCQEADGDTINKIILQVAPEIPAGMNLIVISRAQPNNLFARLIANEQVGRIDGDDLRLTVEEARTIATVKGVTDLNQIAQWHAQCDGWAAGITLTLVDALNLGKNPGFPTLNSRDFLFGYLDLEVFQRLAPEVQDLLLSTALLPRMTPTMAIEMTGNSEAPHLLEELYRKQCFIARNYEPEVSYSYYGMFREFLAQRYATHLRKDRQSELRLKAAKLLEQARDLDAAVTLFADESRLEDISRLILAHANDLYHSGRWQTLKRWLSLLPAEFVDADPWLTYWQGMASKIESPASAKALFGHAYDGFVTSDSRAGQFLAAMAATECIVALGESYRELDVWLAALSPSISELEGLPDDDQLHGWYTYLYAAICRNPDNALIPSGVAWLRTFLEKKHLRPDQILTTGVILILYASLAVNQELANFAIRRVRTHAADDSGPPVLRWLWFYWLGLYHLWRIEYRDAKRCWENCFDIGRHYGLETLDFLVDANMICADLVEDRHQDAQTRIARIQCISAEDQPFAKAMYWLGETFLRFYRKSDDLPQAMDNLLVVASEVGLVNFELLAITDVAALCLLRGENSRAELLLNQANTMASGTIIRRFDGQIKGLEAALAYRNGNLSAAKHALDEALELSQKLGSCGCLLWIRSGFSALFADVLSAGFRPNEINDLIRRYEIPAPSRLTESWPWPVQIRAFGELEIKINGQTLRTGRKAQHRVLALLRLLIADGGNGIDSAVTADKLWPDAEGDVAIGNLRVTMKRLRDLLGHPEAIRISDGKLSLNERVCWVDLWAFEDLSRQITEERSPASFTSQRLAVQIFNLYRGPLLVAESEYWLVDGRDRERSRFCRSILFIAEQMERAGEPGEALLLFQRALEIDPIAHGIRSAMSACQQRQAALERSTGLAEPAVLRAAT